MNEEECTALRDQVDKLADKVDEMDNYIWRLECILRERVVDFPSKV